MGVDENIKTALRLFQAASEGDMDTFDEIMTDDFVTHGDRMFPYVRGKAILQTAIPAFRNAFPDAKLTPEVIFGEGDRVVAHVKVTATHMGPWLGKDGTGQKMEWTASTIIRFNDEGKMAERWVIEDELGVMEMLGVVPPIGFDPKPPKENGNVGSEEERNKQVVRRFYDEIINGRNVDVADEIVAEDFVHHGDAMFPLIEGREALKGGIAYVTNAFPDGHTTLEDEIADDDVVVLRLSWKGTFTNELMGAQPNGKLLHWNGITTYRLADGMIVERWANEDIVPTLQDMGILPPLDQAPEGTHAR